MTLGSNLPSFRFIFFAKPVAVITAERIAGLSSPMLWAEIFFPAMALLFFLLWFTSRAHSAGLVESQRDLQLKLLAAHEAAERDKEHLHAARQALRNHSVRDELTGLPNRASILEVLDREMARAVRDRCTVSLVLVDLDNFSEVNKAYGTAVGDEVLKEVASRLEHAIRSYDTVGRYGGEEFLMVLPSFEGDTGVERLRKIHEAVCGKPIATSSAGLKVTCSFGVSLLLVDQFYSAEELLERADQAMFTAKQDGRNRIGFFARSDA